MVYDVDFVNGDDCKFSVQVKADNEVAALAAALKEIRERAWVTGPSLRVCIQATCHPWPSPYKRTTRAPRSG